MHKLPNRTEKIEKVDLHPNDRELYKFFNATATRIASGSLQDDGDMRSADENDKNILPMINFLRLICNHGEDLLPVSAVETWKLKQTGLVESQMAQSRGESCALCHDNLASLAGSPLCTPCLLTRQNFGSIETAGFSRVESPQGETPTSPRRPSAKVEALIRNLGNEQMGNQNGCEARPVKR